MGSRQQEKERRRQERLAAEQAAAAASQRRRRLQMASGAVLAVAAVAAVAVALASSGGTSKSNATSNLNTGAVTIPPPRISDLGQAATAAGCQLHDYPNFGQEHTTGSVVYKTNPPTSGPHNPIPASDGVYDPGQTPAKEHLVHALEHGRIEIQYRPGTPPAEIRQLEVLFKEPLASKTGQQTQSGYKELLFENETGMPYAVAAVAWQHLLACPTFNNRVFDAIRAFSAKYVDTAPESQSIPFPE